MRRARCAWADAHVLNGTRSTLPLLLANYVLCTQARGLKYSPYDGLRKRPSQSPAERKRDEQLVFPKTLKSGRFENQSTTSQKLFRGVAESSSTTSSGGPDSRFFRKATDYREIQESDPYAKLFGETKSTANIRLNAWQRQFEAENADVELPYERTNLLTRSAPNWFVRYFINIRDKGGLDHAWHLLLIGGIVMTILLAVSYMFFTAPAHAKPIDEIR